MSGEIDVGVSDQQLAEQSGSLTEIERLLSDFRILLHHYVLHSLRDVSAPPGAFSERNPPDQSSALGGPAIRTELLTQTANTIASNPVMLGQLYASLYALSRMVAPADVNTIRLTAAFLRKDSVDPVPLFVEGQAKRLRRWAAWVAGVGFAIFALTIVLLIYVDRGRRSVQQLEQLQTAQNELVLRLGSDRHGKSGACDGTSGEPDPIAAEAQGCAQLRALLIKRAIVEAELATWNSASVRLSMISPVNWLSTTQRAPVGVSTAEWATASIRTSEMISGISGFVLPMLLGLLGSFAYVYRNLDRQLSTATLEPSDMLRGLLRIGLGAILGGLLGVLWTNGQQIQLEGVTLSLCAVAFLVGFSVEIVFQTLEAIIAGVASKLRGAP
jgi:hypothetical protein